MPSRKRLVKTTSPKSATPAITDDKRAERRALATATRDAQTVVAQRTHYGNISNRDDAYLAFYGTIADKRGTVTLAALAAKASNPFYNGSNKASDAGAINRTVKSGRATHSADGTAFTLSPAALNQASALIAKAKSA